MKAENYELCVYSIYIPKILFSALICRSNLFVAGDVIFYHHQS